MSDPIETSRPVHLDVHRSGVFEFYPNIKQLDGNAVSKENKKSLLFLNRKSIEVLQNEARREEIFCQIAKAEVKSSLKNRTVIEITDISSHACSYNYKLNDKIILKTIPLKEISPQDPDYYLKTVCKTEELTLRHFKQGNLGDAILEGLKSVLQFLATPFTALYRLVAGTEARSFAQMLAPVRHDGVGEMTHELFLTHIEFLSRFLLAADPEAHQEKGFEATFETKVHYQGAHRLCRECVDKNGKPYLKIHLYRGWETFNLDDPSLKILAGVHNQPCFEYEKKLRLCKNHDEDNGTVDLFVDRWVDVAMGEDVTFYQGEVRDYKVEKGAYFVKTNAAWKPINKIVGTSNRPYKSIDHQLKPEHQKPIAQSAVQTGAKCFAEAARIGRDIHAARNSGSKSKADALARDLQTKVKHLNNKNRHLIIPLGQGEGRDYIPHFLVFEYLPEKFGPPLTGLNGELVPNSLEPSQILIKHISLSSTSLEEKLNPITTYKLSKSPKGIEKFFQSLISIHPYSRSKDQFEISKKGPLVKDVSLPSLLLELGDTVHSAAPKMTCASRDPVKALFIILKQLGLKESAFSEIDSPMNQIASSKGKFFKFYVDHLIEYYENHEDQLKNTERVRALEGIFQYADQVRHYMEKEMGVDAALAITHHLLSFVEKKLEGLKRTEKLEQSDLKKLESAVNPFQATLSGSIEELDTLTTHAKNVESSRVLIEEIQFIAKIRDQLKILPLSEIQKGVKIKTHAQDKENHDQAFNRVKILLNRAEGYLNRGETQAAKTLLLHLLEALPTPKHHDPDQIEQIWDRLDLQDLDGWLTSLEKIGTLMFEAAARSGTFPLSPHEVFEFHVALPLLQRYLFQLKIPKKVQEFDQAWNNYRNNDQIKSKLKEQLKAFITMREAQIDEEVTKKHEKECQDEDNEYNKQWRVYHAEKALYAARYAAYLAKRLAEDPSAYEPPRPIEPPLIDLEHQKLVRDGILTEKKEQAKNADHFLLELRDVKALPIDSLDWDRLIQGCTPRFVAVIGALAKLIGISKELISYKIGQRGLIRATGYGYSKNADIWLIKHDCSVLTARSPTAEKRYQGCERAFRDLVWNDPAYALQSTNTLLSLLIGYDSLGDGTQFPESAGKEKEKLEETIERHQIGFFNTPEEGFEMLAPPELASCLKVVEARKILSNPSKHLKPYSSGVFGLIINLFWGEGVPLHEAKKKFREMPRIHFVATTVAMASELGCFCLSPQTGSLDGVLSTATSRESPPFLKEKARYLGQANTAQYQIMMGGDEEREVFTDAITHKIFPSLDTIQEFLMRGTAMKDTSLKNKEGRDYSYLSIDQCIEFIILASDKLAVPSIQHTLFKTFLQHKVIRDHILKNPDFFIINAPLLNEICQFFAKQAEFRTSELFLREICHRIRLHAEDLLPELKKRYGKQAKTYVQQISEGLPEYNQKTVGDACLSLMVGRRDQKEFATFALSYYCHQFQTRSPKNAPFDNVVEWGKALNAFYVIQKSPIEVGHTGWQAELIYKVQTELLPFIGKAIKKNENLRNQLLKELSGKEGDWLAIPGKEYAYKLQGQNPFTIDLRTGIGFRFPIESGQKCRLPEQIHGHDHYKLLFGVKDPIVTSIEGDNGKVDYIWKDEENDPEIQFRYDIRSRTFQILQVRDGITYLFQKLTLSESSASKTEQIFRRGYNRTIEEMIEAKGVWIDLSTKPKSGSYEAILAQYENMDFKDPITLKIVGNKIVEASLGKGAGKKIICSNLSDRTGVLISCCDANGLLLLSQKGGRVDEIRFPRDQSQNQGKQNQLILKRRDENATRWVVAGREEWEWVLTDTKDYEKRFGKDWRHYILPLVNRRTNEQELWIFPHMVTAPTKRGGSPKFLKSAADIFKYSGETITTELTDAGPIENSKVDMEMIAAFIGFIEGTFGGGVGTVIEALEILHQKFPDNDVPMNQLLTLLKSISSPRGICYQIGNRGEEKSTYSGLFYLSYIASKRQDWGAATHYMDLMAKSGYSTPEDAKYFQKMVLMALGFEGATSTLNAMAVAQGIRVLFSPKSPSEIAYRAKLSAHLMHINTHLKATQQIDLFAMPEGINLEGPFKLEQLVKAAGSNFYLQYRKLLPQHTKQFREHGLLITQNEEKILTQDPLTSGEALVSRCLTQANRDLGPKAPVNLAQPPQLEIPSPKEIKEMVTAMTGLISAHGVLSIHDLHQQEGTYPKWTTVLSNFWSYWNWIENEKIEDADLTFLFHDIPPQAKYRKEINTARSLLLIWRHYCKENKGNLATHRQSHKSTMKGLYHEIRMKQREVANLGGILNKVERLQQKAANAPSLFNLGRAFFHRQNAAMRLKLSGFVYEDEQGDQKGSRHDFSQNSLDLLTQFLATVLINLKRNNTVIQIEGIGRPKSYTILQPVEHDDPVHDLKEVALQDFLEVFFDSALWKLAAFMNTNEEAKNVFRHLLDLPVEVAWNQLLNLMHTPLFAGARLTVKEISDLSSCKPKFDTVFKNHQQRVRIPTNPYSKELKKGEYEKVKIRLPSGSLQWGDYFRSSLESWHPKGGWKEKSSVWDERAQIAIEKYQELQKKAASENNERQWYKFQKTIEGLEVAKINLKKRKGNSLDVSKLKTAIHEIKFHLTTLKKEEQLGREKILDFARSHAEALAILPLFADRYRFTKEQIFDEILDLYRHGQLARLNNQILQTYLAELITETILITTERQQYEHALSTCTALSQVLKQILSKLPRYGDPEQRKNMAQTLANRDVNWLWRTAELKKFFDGGGDRLRYAEKRADGHAIKHVIRNGIEQIIEKPMEGEEVYYLLRDQQFTRRYLVSDIRNGWVSRQEAIEALEKMLRDLKTSKQPTRFIRAKMGTGKSDFIFPESIDLFLKNGFRPVMVTTEELVPQLERSMGGSAFIFNFDIQFGLGPKTESEQNPPKSSDPTSEQILSHLTHLVETLHHLEAQGKAVLTSPSQIAALRDKRVQLQDMLMKENLDTEKNTTFQQLQLIKQIEGYFRDPRVRILIDEDPNYDNSFEYNYAIGEPDTVDLIRFAVAEHLVYLIQGKCPRLWNMIVNNDLRSIQNVTQEFREVAEKMYDDVDFWKSTGWTEKEWRSINKTAFVDYILGKQSDLPDGMPKWDSRRSSEHQMNKVFVAALKTFLSETLESIYNVNPKLERGIAPNGITVVPYGLDGKPKKNTVYGNEPETILHHIFHYLGVENKIEEAVFDEIEKKLSVLDFPISPSRPKTETWRVWATRIATEATLRGWSKYKAFLELPELAIERFQFLRYLMLDSSESAVRIYKEQITYNSQDLGIINPDIRIGSGTGNRFGMNLEPPGALNLEDYLDDSYSANAVYAETIISTDFNQEIDVMKEDETPLQYIRRKAKDANCKAILNYDYSILKNNVECIAGELCAENRQVIYRDKNLVKKMWYPGDQYFPMAFDAGAIASNAIFLIDRKDTRGVDFPIPRGADYYGVVLIGRANKEDAIAQTLGRMRHLDSGHKGVLACDRKTAAQIRQSLGLEQSTPLTQGHAFLYFSLNSMNDVKDTKAVILRSQKPVKSHLDKAVSGPYDMKGIADPKILLEFESQVVFPTARHLYITPTTNTWDKEYQPQEMIDPIQFVKELYEKNENEGEKAKLSSIKKNFDHLLHQFWKNRNLSLQKSLKDSLEWVAEQQRSRQNDPNYSFEDSLKIHLKQLETKPQAECSMIRELLRKIYAFQSAFSDAEKEIQIEQQRVNEPSYKNFLRQHLPPKIPSNPMARSHVEQKVNQLQQQKKEEKVDEVEKVYTPTSHIGTTNPIDPYYFKRIALGYENIQRNIIINDKVPICDFSINGNCLPLTYVLQVEKGIELPKDLYENIYISERAWSLSKCMGKNGAPLFEIFVVQSEDKKAKTRRTVTVITTPPEREETIAPWLIAERNKTPLVERKKVSQKTAEPNPSYPDEEIWEKFMVTMNDFATHLGQNAFANEIKIFFKNKKTEILLQIKNSLRIPKPDKAWNHFSLKIVSDSLESPKLAPFREAAVASIGALRTPFLEIYQRYQEVYNWINPRSDTERIMVLALSNDKFTEALIPDALVLPEKTLGFLETIVLNKIYLNWTHFTLLELDQLVRLIDSMKEDKFNHFMLQLENYQSTDMANFLKMIRFRTTSNSGQEWHRKVVLRKLNENHIKRVPETFTQEEEELVIKWIREQKKVALEATLKQWKNEKKETEAYIRNLQKKLINKDVLQN